MPDIDITIGGRTFQVSCQDGEEHFLRGAAQMLDAEAQPLVTQLGRLPESRLLLMAGLLLADKTAAVEDENRALKAQIAGAKSGGDKDRVEVPVIPRLIVDNLAEIAARAEALAARVEEKT
jgi:cell division protein ZapA